MVHSMQIHHVCQSRSVHTVQSSMVSVSLSYICRRKLLHFLFIAATKCTQSGTWQDAQKSQICLVEATQQNGKFHSFTVCQSPAGVCKTVNSVVAVMSLVMAFNFFCLFFACTVSVCVVLVKQHCDVFYDGHTYVRNGTR